MPTPPSTPDTAGPQPIEKPVAAVCAATYRADLVPAYAFVFSVPCSTTRFTVYAADAERYLIGETYTLTLTAPGEVPLVFNVEEWHFLRHCLHTVEQRWSQAIASADAGAAQPQPVRPARPGHLNVEPTPAGYRAVGQLLREELDRVRQLGQKLGRLLDAAHAHPDADQP